MGSRRSKVRCSYTWALPSEPVADRGIVVFFSRSRNRIQCTNAATNWIKLAEGKYVPVCYGCRKAWSVAVGIAMGQ